METSVQNAFNYTINNLSHTNLLSLGLNSAAQAINLSVADIVVSTLNVVFNFTYMLNTDWKFGKIYCKISNFIAILSVSASVWSLFAISVDRYLAIIYPLKKRISKFCTINIAIWLFSSILSLPNILYSTIERENFKNGQSKVICYLVWPDGISSKSVSEYIYNLIILLVTYFIPISGMIYAYSRIGIVLWSSKSIGEYCTDKQLESIKSKRKIVKMMIMMICIFAFLWLPYHAYFVLAHHFPEISNHEYVQHYYLAIYALAMSHSTSNPLILCWMNSRFRAGFRSVFCCICLRSKNAKERFKQQYKKQRRQYSECQTNQTRIRCTTISTGHTVQPISNNSKLVLHEHHISTLTNITNKKSINKNDTQKTNNKQPQHLLTRHCPLDHQSSLNHLNGRPNNAEAKNIRINGVNTLIVPGELVRNDDTDDVEKVTKQSFREHNNNLANTEDYNETSDQEHISRRNKEFISSLHKTLIKLSPEEVEKECRLSEFSVEVDFDR